MLQWFPRSSRFGSVLSCTHISVSETHLLSLCMWLFNKSVSKSLGQTILFPQDSLLVSPGHHCTPKCWVDLALEWFPGSLTELCHLESHHPHPCLWGARCKCWKGPSWAHSASCIGRSAGVCPTLPYHVSFWVTCCDRSTEDGGPVSDEYCPDHKPAGLTSRPKPFLWRLFTERLQRSNSTQPSLVTDGHQDT